MPGNCYLDVGKDIFICGINYNSKHRAVDHLGDGGGGGGWGGGGRSCYCVECYDVKGLSIDRSGLSGPSFKQISTKGHESIYL